MNNIFPRFPADETKIEGAKEWIRWNNTIRISLNMMMIFHVIVTPFRLYCNRLMNSQLLIVWQHDQELNPLITLEFTLILYLLHK